MGIVSIRYSFMKSTTLVGKLSGMDAVFTWVGYVAGVLTTGAFLPQVLHTYRVKSASDFSWKMLISFSCGVLLWFVYGVYLHSWPMILANSITLALQGFIISMKIRYER
jgi:MtN3 and saliva related transmembrane protein